MIFMILTILGFTYVVILVTTQKSSNEDVAFGLATGPELFVPIVFILSIIFSVVTIENLIKYLTLKKKEKNQNNTFIK